MKKRKILFFTLGSLLVLYLAFNQVDGPAPHAEFSLSDLPPVNYELNNGFYLLYTFTEPEDVDFESKEILFKYRQCFDPQYDNLGYMKEMNMAKHQGKGSRYMNKIRETLVFKSNFPRTHEGDWVELIRSGGEQIIKDKESVDTVFKRYERIMDYQVLTDVYIMDARHPVPHLLLLLHMAPQYNAYYTYLALKGSWEAGVEKILYHLDFCKRLIRGSAVLITRLVAQHMLRCTLVSLNSLMNQKECPPSIFQLISDHMIPITYEEYGYRKSIIGEGLVISSIIDWHHNRIGLIGRVLNFLFFQKNRVIQAHYNKTASVLEMDSTPPYLWSSTPKSEPDPTSKSFWWLQNPAGKLLLSEMTGFHDWYPNQVGKAYLTKAYYDMVKIAADLHLNYDGDIPTSKLLLKLKTYKDLTDLCSGKPYSWNETRQVLYSLGVDRKDNDGEFKGYKHHQDSDYSLPVILYLK